jgi:hypothetical protein
MTATSFLPSSPPFITVLSRAHTKYHSRFGVGMYRGDQKSAAGQARRILRIA